MITVTKSAYLLLVVLAVAAQAFAVYRNLNKDPIPVILETCEKYVKDEQNIIFNHQKVGLDFYVRAAIYGICNPLLEAKRRYSGRYEKDLPAVLKQASLESLKSAPLLTEAKWRAEQLKDHGPLSYLTNLEEDFVYFHEGVRKLNTY